MAPDQSLLTLKTQLSPAAYAAHLRSLGDLFWWKKGNFWVVTHFSLATEVLKDPAMSADRSSFFISRMPNLDLNLVTDFFAVVSKMMVMSDDDSHRLRRGIAALGLTDEVMRSTQPKISETVNTLLTQALNKGSFDFVSDVADKLPSLILADLFSIPEEQRSDFVKWSNNMTQFFGGASQYRNEDGVEVNQSANSLRDYFSLLIKERRRNPGPDFFSTLLKNQEAFGLSDSEVISQAVMMIVAGQITTTDQICNNLFSLLTVPGAREQLQNSPSEMRTAIEELNRLDPAVTFIFRVTREDTKIGSTFIPKGKTIFISTHAANRDPLIFENPNFFIANRRNNPHFAYGYGSHVCLGAKLARLQMAELFSQFLRECAEYQVDLSQTRRKHRSLAFSGFESMRLEKRTCLRSDSAYSIGHPSPISRW